MSYAKREVTAPGRQPDRLDLYRAERERAHAAVIDASMERRRRGAIPDLCDGGYEVFEQ